VAGRRGSSFVVPAGGVHGAYCFGTWSRDREVAHKSQKLQRKRRLERAEKATKNERAATAEQQAQKEALAKRRREREVSLEDDMARQRDLKIQSDPPAGPPPFPDTLAHRRVALGPLVPRPCRADRRSLSPGRAFVPRLEPAFCLRYFESNRRTELLAQEKAGLLGTLHAMEQRSQRHASARG
jgi:hypothetical protein